MNCSTNTQIHVALIAYNGARFLPAQLESLSAQSHQPASVWISDDGSVDHTLELVNAFQKAARFPVYVRQGPKQGAAANMAELVHQMPGGAIATCDQDDVWRPDRLMWAAAHFGNSSSKKPMVHVCARAPVLWRRTAPPRPSFANALAENAAPGNSVVFNAEAVRVLQGQSLTSARYAPFFDWWAFQLVLGVGGLVSLDPRRGLFYRAHTKNVLGPRYSYNGLVSRARNLANGTYANWVLAQAEALSRASHVLLPEHRSTLAEFLALARDGLWHSSVRRRSQIEQLCLRAAWRWNRPNPREVNQRFT
ncbi:glycosyltransferase [Litoreibacter janthinus]|uniref:Glycosyl transferase family 2 n=1 Tax=Litoreibacter janthinus TaxID=670154 RepID=A0A1I6ICN4_9RHOB|nr:glycosyltransferase [Litoreibacter janthinus]SFR64527.1 Glycosyl transferase family 2 [Litoreibacter janthinus]